MLLIMDFFFFSFSFHPFGWPYTPQAQSAVNRRPLWIGVGGKVRGTDLSEGL